MIHIKKCRKCGKLYDFKECPYCRIKKLKRGKENVKKQSRN